MKAAIYFGAAILIALGGAIGAYGTAPDGGHPVDVSGISEVMFGVCVLLFVQAVAALAEGN